MKHSLFFIAAITLLLSACGNETKNKVTEYDTEVYVPEYFLPPDTIAAIRQTVYTQVPVTNAVQTPEGLTVQLPLFYTYEEVPASIALPFISTENAGYDNAENGDGEEAGKPENKAWLAYKLIPSLANKYDFEEQIVIAETGMRNEEIISHFKDFNYDKVDKLIYEDATNYIGIGSFNAVMVFSFSTDTTTGNRYFYYAKCKPEGLTPKETVRFAFQLVQHGQNFLLAAKPVTAIINFSDQLNEVEYKIINRLTHSLKKETAVFLDDKSLVRYKLLAQSATLYLLPDALAAPLTRYTTSLPLQQKMPIDTLAELCDAVGSNFINLWRQETVSRIPSTPVENSNIIQLEIVPANHTDIYRRRYLLAPVTVNSKKSLLWLEISSTGNSFEQAAYLQLLQFIQSKI